MPTHHPSLLQGSRADRKPAGLLTVGACVLLSGLLGCGSDGDAAGSGAGGSGAGGGTAAAGAVDLTGLSDADAAASVAGALCGWLAECGQSLIACDIPQGGGATCAGGLNPVALDTCLSEKTAPVLADLPCLGRTTQLDDEIAECINAQVAGRCTTQADVDAQAELLAQFFDGAGPDPGSITPWPEVCEGLRSRLQAECSTDGEEMTLTCSNCF